MNSGPLHPDLAATHWLGSGEVFVRRLLRALTGAKRSIRLEVYIFANDRIGRAVRDALTLATLQGVEVKVLLDALGSNETRGEFWTEFIRVGGQLRWFNPLELRRLPVRDHRKLLVVDERAGGTGGFNVAEEYSGDGVSHGWADLGIVLYGPAVGALAAEFDRMWAAAADTPNLRTLLKRNFRTTRRIVAPDIQLLATGPGRTAGAFQLALREDLAQANDILMIVAYFLPTRGMRTLLRQAAARGVRVRVVVPGKSDVEFSRRAARHLYGRLLRHGIQLFEYQPQVLHAKLFLTQAAAYVGSSNLDVRSLYINHELMLRLTDPDIVQRGWHLGEELCSRSARIDPDTWPSARSWFERLRDQWSWWVLSKADPFVTRWLARDPR
ncbi:MAG TPA: phosphatidylserine/phosphatidylglycerophosphate/cardiolipin synthase family protein [Verrucomicrobiota bacterium]|nr:phosphatidylserine/phosphatidylglycerophosphate/cardiolipin synthase family protein [Verrucomicrobiota bacterium]